MVGNILNMHVLINTILNKFYICFLGYALDPSDETAHIEEKYAYLLFSI